MRKFLVVPMLLALCIPCVAQKPDMKAKARQKLEKQLRKIAKEHAGKVALYARNLKTGDEVGLEPDEVVKTASTIKLLALVEGFHQIKAGKKLLGDKVILNKDDQVGGSGIFPFMRPPAQLTLEDVLTFMIIVSDNTGTNLAIDQLGLANINARATALGLKNTYLYKKVFKPAEGVLPPDQKKYGLGKTTAREMATLIAGIEECELKDAELCKKMLSILKNQQYRDAIPRYIETADTSEVPSAIANKTGSLDALRADVALIYTKSGTIALAIFTYENKDQRWNADNQGTLTMAKLAKAVVDAWAPKGMKSGEEAKK